MGNASLFDLKIMSIGMSNFVIIALCGAVALRKHNEVAFECWRRLGIISDHLENDHITLLLFTDIAGTGELPEPVPFPEIPRPHHLAYYLSTPKVPLHGPRV